MPRVRELPRGEEQYCEKGNIGTYGAKDVDGTITQGGYSEKIVVDEHFVLRVPESIPYEKAAPLLCAGITTYSPLNHWNAGPGKKVAVVGLGGLGHMAVKIAHAMGAEVTVLSQTLSKKDDGLKMGADHYYATKDDETFSTLKKHFDLIINTVSAPLDLKQYLGLLALNGTMVNVGAPPEPCRSRSSRCSPTVVPSRVRRSAASARPRRCSTSAPRTASRPRPSSSRPTRSTRRTSAC